jgi:N,N-dimethylformamidase
VTSPRLHRLSPVPGLGLEGYTDEISLTAGDTVEVKVSAAPGAPQRVVVDTVRLLHGDTNPDGPGLVEEPVAWGGPSELPIAEQTTDYGSHIEVSHDGAFTSTGSFTMAMWYQPTRIDGWHCLASIWSPDDMSFGLWLTGSRIIVGGVSLDGVDAQWTVGFEHVQEGSWQFAALTYDAPTGEIAIHQHAPAATFRIHPSTGLVSLPKRRFPGAIRASGRPLLLGATESVDSTGLHWAHLNGRIADPMLFGCCLDHETLDAIAQGTLDPAEVDGLLGRWDLSRDIATDRAVDVSGHGRHGVIINAPARGVIGPHVDQRPYADEIDEPNLNRSPALYDAVHLHEDDLDDAHWPSVTSVAVPPDATSGIYAVRVTGERERIYLPFVVKPERPSAPLAILLPTYTWQTYGSNRLPTSNSEDGVIDRTIGGYESHTDGSVVHHTTRRRPTRSWHPSTGTSTHGAHTIEADLYLEHWLVHEGYAHDVLTDEHLHHGGLDALAPYRCLVITGHPEYWTTPMMRGLKAWLERGGRLAFLAGNGLGYVTSVDAARPWLLEIRRIINPFVPWPAYEDHHSTTGERGGEWSAHRRITPVEVTGVDIVGQYFLADPPAPGYVRTPASHQQRFSWIFDGVTEDPIGEYGLNLGSAASFEMDGVYESFRDDDPARATIRLAIAGTGVPLMGGRGADIAYTPYPNGGGVFVAGAVSWTGSLSHAGGSNGVARITHNVLRRFLDTPDGEAVLPS